MTTSLWVSLSNLDLRRRYRDGGRVPGGQQLERENRELRRANEILKTAAAFFERELDLRPPR
jgi:transposase